jgi:nitroreductase
MLATDSFEQLVTNQRACRRFQPDEDVSDTELEQMITYAIHAPNANNWQPWEFVIVRDQQVRADFGEMIRAHWMDHGYKTMPGSTSPEHFRSANDGHQGGFQTAPVLVIACNDLNKVPELWAASSIYPACQNLLLGAAALGYASCFTTGLTTLMESQVRQMLQLPENLLPLAGIYIGRAAKPLGPPKRDPARSHMHREVFGAGWREAAHA